MALDTEHAQTTENRIPQCIVPRDEPWERSPDAAINRVVNKKYRIRPEDLRLHRHAVDEAKRVAVELAAPRSGKTLRAIGEHYDGITGQAVAMIRRRVRRDDGVDWQSLEKALDKV